MSDKEHEEWLPAYDHKSALILIKELQAENQLAWNTCDEAETKANKLQAQVIALQNKPCCLCPHLQAKLEALKPYIRHKSPCEFKTVGLSKCACGLLQALEQK